MEKKGALRVDFLLKQVGTIRILFLLAFSDKVAGVFIDFERSAVGAIDGS